MITQEITLAVILVIENVIVSCKLSIASHVTIVQETINPRDNGIFLKVIFMVP